MNQTSRWSQRPNWLEIDLAAIANNVQRLRQLIGPDCLLMAVVKANAYGHGAVAVAGAALDAGANRLAVAALNEAVELRMAGIDAPILILGYTPPRQAADVSHYQATATIFDLEMAQALGTVATTEEPAVVHVKVNTGMNRLGLSCEATLDFLTTISKIPHLKIEGIFTHFATADETDKRHTLAQFTRFSTLLHQLEDVDLRPPIAHAANSAATLTLPQTHLQMVRPGIALYGLHPDAEQTQLPAGFRPALCWKAEVAQIIELQPGDAVSYGREFIAAKPMRVAVIPVGYADGFPRRPYNWDSILIRGQFAPILGRVCMDQTIIDITNIANAIGCTPDNNGNNGNNAVDMQEPIQQGEEVVLIGHQGASQLSVDEISRRLCTINYDVVSRILSRVPRLFQRHTD